MPLPSQEPKDSYSADEVAHIVARETARRDLDRLNAEQIELHKQMVETFGAINAELKSFKDTVAGIPAAISAQISQCRSEMRAEVRDTHPSRIEAIEMEKRIEDKITEGDRALKDQIAEVDKKVDGLKTVVEKMWLKIATVVATIMAVGGVVQWLLVTTTTAQKVIGQ